MVLHLVLFYFSIGPGPALRLQTFTVMINFLLLSPSPFPPLHIALRIPPFCFPSQGSYMQGATLLCVGSFLSIPSQGWMLSAMSVQLAVYESRMTVYKGPSSRHSPNRPK